MTFVFYCQISFRGTCEMGEIFNRYSKFKHRIILGPHSQKWHLKTGARVEAADLRFWTRGSLFFVHCSNSWKATSKITLAPSSSPNSVGQYDRPLFSGFAKETCSAHPKVWTAQNCKIVLWLKQLKNMQNKTWPESTSSSRFIFPQSKKHTLLLKDAWATRYMKDEKIPRTRFLFNCGILLCLTLGFSILTFAELLYHFLLLLASCLGVTKRNNENWRASLYLLLLCT